MTVQTGAQRAFMKCAEKARQYASNYKPSSDGWNTFIMLADWAEGSAAEAAMSTDVPKGWLIRDVFDADPEAWFYTVYEDQAKEYADDGVAVFSLPTCEPLPAAPTGGAR